MPTTCPDHHTPVPAHGVCYWCEAEAEATDQAAGLALVRAAIRKPPTRPPGPTLDQLEDNQ